LLQSTWQPNRFRLLRCVMSEMRECSPALSELAPDDFRSLRGIRGKLGAAFRAHQKSSPAVRRSAVSSRVLSSAFLQVVSKQIDYAFQGLRRLASLSQIPCKYVRSESFELHFVRRNISEATTNGVNVRVESRLSTIDQINSALARFSFTFHAGADVRFAFR